MRDRALSPTGTAIALVLAFIIDYMSAGPDSIRDRMAFLLALAGFRDGFNGSPLDAATVEKLSSIIRAALDSDPVSGAYIAGASVNGLIGMGVGALAIYVVGCLLPVRFSKKVGRFAAVTFPRSPAHRINWKLWLCAFFLGILADLGQGLIGGWIEGSVITLTQFVDPLLVILFGGA